MFISLRSYFAVQSIEIVRTINVEYITGLHALAALPLFYRGKVNFERNSSPVSSIKYSWYRVLKSDKTGTLCIPIQFSLFIVRIGNERFTRVENTYFNQYI